MIRDQAADLAAGAKIYPFYQWVSAKFGSSSLTRNYAATLATAFKKWFWKPLSPGIIPLFVIGMFGLYNNYFSELPLAPDHRWPPEKFQGGKRIGWIAGHLPQQLSPSPEKCQLWYCYLARAFVGGTISGIHFWKKTVYRLEKHKATDWKELIYSG